MLLRVILFWFFVFAVVVAWRWWRASRLIESGGLNLVEVKRMLKIAEKSKRMEAALLMRTRILGEAQKANMQELTARVDPVIRKLARQVELRDDIAVILSELDEAQLEKEIRTAELERAETKRDQLETQLKHVKSLRVRRSELEEAADRIIRELQNLHLALVNASATEAKAQLESGDVQSSLAHLEEASNELKNRAQAEDEIATLVRSSRAAGKVTNG
jgi:hypothetical protein